MEKSKILDIRHGYKNLVVLNLGRQTCNYISHENSCMIEAWDIEQALRIFKLNNPERKRKKRRD